MAYNIDAEIKVARSGLAMHNADAGPPGVVGHDRRYRSINPVRSRITANKLLDEFGYKVGADGWRTLPDGKPLLSAHRSRRRGSLGREYDEVWTRLARAHRRQGGGQTRRSSPTT